ncbi:PLP-dependent aminotransferase family protein [Enterobacteriaceae bacterium EKM102V]|uniref:MocR-like pyridoxine biosynthesis transcription factor PdxR n=1 Tax=Pantoea TaxID=53335 RepID=UPI00142E376C|nr:MULTISPECIES: PLP-dependent aminotransferase family protein [Pantoea]KAF6658154.1 PLP-dependent aminotransferase family protein [Enterobacteriaceae bacterium EKM102V]KAF6666759.1 PLP-dependent aminotransferase family protein [Pantoea sp. EKM103V]
MPKNESLTGPSPLFSLTLQRGTPRGLSEQLRQLIEQAIGEGRLQPGARLPSCRDLAAQLGVARGTVRASYDMLADGQFLETRGAAGTFVSTLPPLKPARSDAGCLPPHSAGIEAFDAPPLTFQMGTPASDAFPAKVWLRILQRQARMQVSRPASYPDPRGSLALRQALVAYLAVARGLRCQAEQIMITSGYAGAMGLIGLAMDFQGKTAWLEDPGFWLARGAVEALRISPVAVPVDEEGMQVAAGVTRAPDAAFALVTPGQQAPLGMTMSLARRHALLEWASREQRWIIEDDYLGELQPGHRAAPALAALDSEGRVLHIGTFSKTLTPQLRLGFMVVPPALAARFGEVCALLAPASAGLLHNAVAEFLREGHFMRHLRRMKRVYHERLEQMVAALHPHFPDLQRAGLAVIVRLPAGSPDQLIAQQAAEWGMAPSPLSVWYQDADQRRAGLLLGAAHLPREGYARSAGQLKALVDAHCAVRP